MSVSGNITTGKVGINYDYIPILSTAASLINLFLKALSYVLPESFKENTVFSHVNEISTWRSLILLVPVLGNIAVAIYDYRMWKAETLFELATSESDDVKAFALFKQAAELGHVEAVLAVGFNYAEGRGTDKNFIEAAKWFKKGADLGNSDAMVQIGTCYYRGEGVNKDVDQAILWWKEAAKNENSDAIGLIKRLSLQDV